MICQSCKVVVPDGMRFCPICGKRLSDREAVSTPLQQTAEATEEQAQAQAVAVEQVSQVIEDQTQVSQDTVEPSVEHIATQTDATADSAEEVQKKKIPRTKLLKKRWFISVAGVLALALCLGFVLLGIHNGKQRRYNEGVLLLDAGKYSEAQAVFAKLETFDDSDQMEEYSANMARYTAALALVDQENYKGAADAFLALGAFQDSPEQAQLCQNELTYINAMELYAAGDFQAAKDAFSALGAFHDAIAKGNECDRILRTAEADALYEQGDFVSALPLYEALLDGEDTTIQQKYYYCQNVIAYSEAEALYIAGEYYDAYLAFSEIFFFEDAGTRSEDCIQPFPTTGEVYHNDNYSTRSCSLVIRTPSEESSNNYIKIYSETGDLVSTIAIGSGKSAKVWLPAGEYRVKNAYGNDWFGEDDLFGDMGTYNVLKNGYDNNEFFKLENNYSYTLTLRTSGGSGDNVNTESEDRNGF